MKILNTTWRPDDFWKAGLEERVPGIPLAFVRMHRAGPGELSAGIADADFVLGDATSATKLDRTVIEAARQLKLIQQPSTGYNQIDIEACSERGIPVANTPGANDSSVGEHTVMLALACLKKLPFFNARTHAGEWLFPDSQRIGVFEIEGKTYGLIGMGRTAREVARRLVPFGVRLLYYDLVRLPGGEEAALGATYAPIEEILLRSDIVSVHLPLAAGTRGIIDAKKLGLMKPSAVFINVGRGELVDEAALASALRDKKLGAAALDVFGTEPPPADHPLLGLENVILTPHLAGATNEARARIVSMAMDNIARVIRGEAPLWVVNPKKRKQAEN